MGKKVNWSALKERLDAIFGPDVMGMDGWNDEEEIVKESPVIDFLTNKHDIRIRDANIQLLQPANEIDYDDCSQEGDDVYAVFSLDDSIYRVKLRHYSYSGFDLQNVTAEEVAPKIKQIIYYE